MNNEQTPSWHGGELTIQQRVGTANRMAEIGPKFIREFMPEQHREYFESLSMLFIGYTDHYSIPRASVLFGSPGFIESPTETELVINTQNSMGDAIHQQLIVGDRIGLVGVMFDNKRLGFNSSTSPYNFYANTNGAETTDTGQLDFVSNGFKIRNGGGTVNKTSTYIFMAFAESPLVTSTGVPTTAR